MLIRVVFGGALLLPYKLRIALVGKTVNLFAAPLAGWRTRIRKNLAYAMPDMAHNERERIVRKVADNVGRTLTEIYSGEEFISHIKTSEITGPGKARLEQARDAKEPVVLVTAHLGNYDAVRGKLSREGYPMAALYRPMKNSAFNAHYVKAISTIAKPVYPTDGTGIISLIKHLKRGGIIGVVADVGSRKAPLLSFFGKPAHTPTSAAEWAVRFNAVMIPVFGIRQPDGYSFQIHVADPIASGPPEQMMQAYNDAVEEIVRDHPDQWFWIHRRWKLRPDLVNADAPPPE